jgi:two-component system, OmpR family, phosphate regulon response regulator PhoB
MQVSKVLVVDGDRGARDALVTCLQFVGVEAHGAESALAARSWLTTGVADVLVLSEEFTENVPADSDASILVLTRAQTLTPPRYRIDGTMQRPVALSRVVERVESLIEERSLRRESVLRFGVLALDVPNGRASKGDRHAVLGHIEARLLAFFMGAPDKVFSRAQLLQKLWPSNVRVADRTVDAHIRRLRVALMPLGCEEYVQTVRCAGYRFSAF